MAINTTTNYNLKKPDGDEFFNKSHQNDNMDLIDSALNTKLDKTTYTASDVLNKIKTVDGTGTGLDADLLDGQHAAAFATAAQGTKADNALAASSYTASDVLNKIKTVDGTDSGLDADTVDGLHGSQLVRNDIAQTLASGLKIKGTGTGITNISSIGFYESNETTLAGFLGFNSLADNTFDITNAKTNADINLQTLGSGTVKVNGNEILNSANFSNTARGLFNDSYIRATTDDVGNSYGILAFYNYSHTTRWGYIGKANVSYNHFYITNEMSGGKTIFDGSSEVQVINSFTVGTRLGTIGSNSFVQGNNCTASGGFSHAHGNNCTASGSYTHAEGGYTTASHQFAHAEGENTTASGFCSHAQNRYTIAQAYAQTAIGKYNIAQGTIDTVVATDNAFVIGNGTANASRSNAFRVTFDGKTYGLSAFNSSGADYAEFFEWLDGNSNNEDRVGYFVTLDGKKIRKANSTDDYILGIVSANATVIGDTASENWNGKYITDNFGRIQYEYVDVPAEIDESGKEISPARQDYVPKINPEWDNTLEYIPREKRKEWSPIGLMGKLLVYDDGTCQVNGYCKPNDDGIATTSTTGYRVIDRIDTNIIQILVK